MGRAFLLRLMVVPLGLIVLIALFTNFNKRPDAPNENAAGPPAAFFVSKTRKTPPKRGFKLGEILLLLD
ncbi:MAG: hypothetical protein AB7P20_28860 [Rhizobiaceae bacterium]